MDKRATPAVPDEPEPFDAVPDELVKCTSELFAAAASQYSVCDYKGAKAKYSEIIELL